MGHLRIISIFLSSLSVILQSAHLRFCEFADLFLQLYEPIVQTQSSRPLTTTEEAVAAQPLRLQDTAGHPRDLVVHVAKSLLSFLDIQSDILGVGTAAGEVVINVQTFFVQSDEASKTDLISLWKLRQQFVRTLRCLSGRSSLRCFSSTLSFFSTTLTHTLFLLAPCSAGVLEAQSARAAAQPRPGVHSDYH
jgi:hypothetical protein